VKPPSPRGRTYNLWKASNSWYSQAGQDKRLEDTIFANMTHPGFFIESGAADGEVNSNTLHYEKKGWSGLLVEPHPSTFKTLMGKNRKAYAFNGALSTTGRPGRMYLDFHDCAGYQGDGECSKLVSEPTDNSVMVPIAPLSDLLLFCLQRTTVDFWSLDVEGVESNILQSFPFELIEVGVLLIEMNKNDENNDGIMSVMAKYRFKECGRTVFDRIYVNPRYFRRRWLRTPVEC